MEFEGYEQWAIGQQAWHDQLATIQREAEKIVTWDLQIQEQKASLDAKVSLEAKNYAAKTAKPMWVYILSPLLCFVAFSCFIIASFGPDWWAVGGWALLALVLMESLYSWLRQKLLLRKILRKMRPEGQAYADNINAYHAAMNVLLADAKRMDLPTGPAEAE